MTDKKTISGLLIAIIIGSIVIAIFYKYNLTFTKLVQEQIPSVIKYDINSITLIIIIIGLIIALLVKSPSHYNDKSYKKNIMDNEDDGDDDDDYFPNAPEPPQHPQPNIQHQAPPIVQPIIIQPIIEQPIQNNNQSSYQQTRYPQNKYNDHKRKLNINNSWKPKTKKRKKLIIRNYWDPRSWNSR